MYWNDWLSFVLTLCQYFVPGKGHAGALKKLQHPAPCSRGYRICLWNLRIPAHVGVRDHLASLCTGNDIRQLSFPLQHGLVGIHIPARRVRSKHHATGQGAGSHLFPDLWDGELTPLQHDKLQ